MKLLRGIHICSEIAVNVALFWLLYVCSEVAATVGSTQSDTVYRHEASNTGKERVGSLQPFSGSVYKDSEEVEGFYDY